MENIPSRGFFAFYNFGQNLNLFLNKEEEKKIILENNNNIIEEEPSAGPLCVRVLAQTTGADGGRGRAFGARLGRFARGGDRGSGSPRWTARLRRRRR